jgi:putative NADH-flavin reductase
MAKLLVIGASRGIGLETVKAALLAGHSVRAFGGKHTHPKYEPGEGIRRCPRYRHDSERTQKFNVVVQTLGVDISPRAIFEPTTLFSQSTRLLIGAMKAAGVKRLIAVTGLGAGDSRGHGGFLYDTVAFPLLLKRVYDDKDVQESLIRSSGLDWIIVRPGLLTNSPATGQYRVLIAPNDWRFGTISRVDVADFIVRQIDDTALIGATPLLIN